MSSADGRSASPHFAIGAGFATYEGPIGAGKLHRHAAFQLIVGTDVAVIDDAAHRTSGSAVVVSPMTWHCLLPNRYVVTHFVEPHCAFADRLRDEFPAGITAAPTLAELRSDELTPAVGRPSAQLDPRLTHALSCLTHGGVSLSELPTTVGLGAARLRSLARRQLGMPLSRWRTWSRLHDAAAALQQGHDLATAAERAGFSDQAHFTRRLREMMGMTPSALIPILRPAQRDAT